MFDIGISSESHIFSTDEVYSVSGFLKQLHTVLRETVPMVWISAEISNITYASSGHIYLSLKDEHSVIKCVIFRLSAKRIRFELTTGMNILVNASLNIYEPRGDIQLVIAKVEPVGVGAIELALKQLKEKLAKQGMFDMRHKQALPRYPQSIGVITSKKGAVVQDIIRILGMRYPLAQLVIYDTLTQGEQAVGQILNALSYADTKGHDTLIIARGGGSAEDLFVFNDEVLAMAVFHARTPIISSIGHEIDTTILDFVADYSAATPSAAAMVVAPDSVEIIEQIETYITRMHQAIYAQYATYTQTLQLLSKSLATPGLDGQYLSIERSTQALKQTMIQSLHIKEERCSTLTKQLHSHNPAIVLQSREYMRERLTEHAQRTIEEQVLNATYKLEYVCEQLQQAMKICLQDAQLHYSSQVQALEFLSPLEVLSRGYSISTTEQKAIHSHNDVVAGDVMTTRVADGHIHSTVTNTSSL